MTAKELAENSFVPTGSDENANILGYYHFTPEELKAFTEQLCKEQRELCLHNATRGADGYTAILKAPMPEL